MKTTYDGPKMTRTASGQNGWNGQKFQNTNAICRIINSIPIQKIKFNQFWGSCSNQLNDNWLPDAKAKTLNDNVGQYPTWTVPEPPLWSMISVIFDVLGRPTDGHGPRYVCSRCVFSWAAYRKILLLNAALLKSKWGDISIL